MLAQKSRLTGVKNFKAVEVNGEIYQSENFGIARLNRNDDGPSRFAFVVSSKVAKDAVDRNKFKRAMSEAVRTSMIDVKNGFDVVFLAKTSIVRIPTSELMREVKFALKDSGLIK